MGCVITGFTSVAGNDHYFGGMMRLNGDTLIPQHARLVKLAHEQGVSIIAQLALGACYWEQPNGKTRHTEPDGDFSQAERITHRGMLLVGTLDNFTKGDPTAFLENLNSHMPTAAQNEIVFIERTGHTYQMKEQEVANALLETVTRWRKEG